MSKTSSQIVGIVSHDAGGAEVLSSYVSHHKMNVRYSLAGPAVSIFGRKLNNVPICSVRKVVEESDWLLCSTSWQSDLEWEALRLARSSKKRCIAFLDHWTNYSQRFLRHGQTVLPDEIWVCDKWAQNIAEQTFNGVRVVLVDNPFFKDIEMSWAQIKKPETKNIRGTRILFVSDNIEQSLSHQFGDGYLWGYTDQDSLRYLLAHIDYLSTNVDRVTIRPHPSESSPNYRSMIKDHEPLAIMSSGKALLEEISDHDIVAGSESMAMCIALLCGKRVISCVPPYGKVCSLPYPSIEKLSALQEGPAL